MTYIDKAYVAGRKYAKEESASLAGVWPDPSIPNEYLGHPEFERGYEDYLNEPSGD